MRVEPEDYLVEMQCRPAHELTRTQSLRGAKSPLQSPSRTFPECQKTIMGIA